MRCTTQLWCLLRGSRVTLARRGHGGTAQTQRELERLALLEQTMAQPAPLRARQQPAPASAAAAAYLRELPQRVKRLRSEEVSRCGTSGEGGQTMSDTTTDGRAGISTTSSSSGPQVTTLTQFLDTCKTKRIQFSSAVSPAMRRRGREDFRVFWSAHAGSAVASCFDGVRELGFLASLGLADDGLNLELREMRTMLRVLQAQHAVATSVDCTRILAYLARELHFWEQQQQRPARHCHGGRGEANEGSADGPTLPSAASLLAFREQLTDTALVRLATSFVPHATAAEVSAPSPAAAKVQRVGTHSGVDAVWGLEALTVLHARDATEATLRDIWTTRQLCKLRRLREPPQFQALSAFPETNRDAAAVSLPVLADEVQYLLAAELFRSAAVRHRDLRMTDIVHAYALLRVHLPLLWPPYRTLPRQRTRDDGLHAAAPLPGPPPPRRRLPLWYEKDTLFRATWGLAVALASKDSVFVSSYHFVKIVATLAKLPAFVLSPEPQQHRKELHRLALPLDATGDVCPDAEEDAAKQARLVSAGIAAAVLRQHSDLGAADQATDAEEEEETPPSRGSPVVAVALQPSQFWRFIIAKACVFVPGLPAEQRRVVCRGLQLAIAEKRAALLSLGAGSGAPGRPVRRSARRLRVKGFGPIAADALSIDEDSSDTAEQILQPLVAEMEGCPMTFAECAAPSPSFSSSSHGSGTRRRPKRHRRPA